MFPQARQAALAWILGLSLEQILAWVPSIFSPLARYPLEGGRPKGGGTIPAQIKQQNDFNKLDKHNILCYNNNRIGLLTILLLVRLSEQTVD